MLKYKVALTQTAEEAYARIFEDAAPLIKSGNTTNAKVKLLRVVDECLEKIIPADPFDPSRALAGDLKNIFRVKKGRVRICYIGSSEKRSLLVLFISETLRKAGDKNDPYAIFTGLVMSGKFQEFFDRLGVKPPPLTARARPTIQ
ncbi:MAG: type II toxin-antitoxin system YhaV family toxin [Bryobacteraceae bacterium]|nr:type II toxin-antitoxin system YhaV family toxin [Bryobacteraceae bacterium]